MRVAYAVGAPRISRQAGSTTPGPRNHINGFVGGLRQRGHEVSTFVFSEDVTARFAQVEESSLRQGNVVRGVLQDVLRILFGVVAALRVGSRIRETPDIFYERFATFQTLGWWFQRRGAKWVVESNGLFFIEAARDRKSLALVKLAELHEKWTYRRADLVVAVSDEIAAELRGRCRVPHNRVMVLPNGVDTELFRPTGATVRRFGPDNLVIGFVGQLIEWQGLDDLLVAMASLPSRVVLTVVGDGPDRARLEGLVKQQGLDDRVVFTGRLEPGEVAAHLRGFDLCYAGHRDGTSRTYHSPLKVYEYAAAGIPIVGTGSAALDDVRDAVPVAEFIPGDPRFLARAVEEFEPLANGHDAAGRVKSWTIVGERFGWADKADRVLERVFSRG